jgi:hypothetical protein
MSSPSSILAASCNVQGDLVHLISVESREYVLLSRKKDLNRSMLVGEKIIVKVSEYRVVIEQRRGMRR